MKTLRNIIIASTLVLGLNSCMQNGKINNNGIYKSHKYCKEKTIKIKTNHNRHYAIKKKHKHYQDYKTIYKKTSKTEDKSSNDESIKHTPSFL